MDKRWSFDLIRFCRLGGFAMREKVFCFSLLWVLLQGGECLYTVILWVAVLVRHCNTILLLIDQKKKKPCFIMRLISHLIWAKCHKTAFSLLIFLLG